MPIHSHMQLLVAKTNKDIGISRYKILQYGYCYKTISCENALDGKQEGPCYACVAILFGYSIVSNSLSAETGISPAS
jgi:hypothetical protein